MTVEVHRSEKCRHVVFRQSGDDALPEVVFQRLQEEGVACGWLRASGVLANVALRAYDARLGGLGEARLIAGPVQALSIEGAIGLVAGAPSCALRAVLAREGDAGLEVLAGEIQSARALSLEVFVTSLDDLAIPRGDPTPTRADWSTALAASEDSGREPPRAAQAPGATPSATKMPQKLARQAVVEVDSPVPNAGDVVEHFAFGPCDVVKSDGDRLHLRMHKDGRIKEIALDMLRVTPLGDSGGSADSGGPRRFRLDRRM